MLFLGVKDFKLNRNPTNRFLKGGGLKTVTIKIGREQENRAERLENLDLIFPFFSFSRQ